jgi:phage terminase large subunit-like protein
MSAEQLEVFARYTGRATAPAAPFNECYLVCGRRAGKSAVLALLAVFIATFRDYSAYLAPGERGTLPIIASDRRQARTIFRYMRALLHEIPLLAQLIQRETSESFDLSNRVTLEIHTSNYRSVRGYTLIGGLIDELAFLRSDDSASPDTEVLAALRPGMSTFPGAMPHGAWWPR